MSESTVSEALVQATVNSDLPAMEAALDRGADVHAWGGAALCWATIKGCRPAVNRLLRAGADVATAIARLEEANPANAQWLRDVYQRWQSRQRPDGVTAPCADQAWRPPQGAP